MVQTRGRAPGPGEGVSKRWGGLPLNEPLPKGDGWAAMGPDQPRHCEVCGKRLRLRKDSIWFQTSEPKRSWHTACRLERRKR